ncbi:hypothetical protein [Kitasatospora sp. NPDC004531]
MAWAFFVFRAGSVRPGSLTTAATSSAGEADARRAYEIFVHEAPHAGLPEFGAVLGPYPGNPVIGVGRPGRFVGYPRGEAQQEAARLGCGAGG